jgi:type II secretory pathway predicted ATPase ExeA
MNPFLVPPQSPSIFSASQQEALTRMRHVIQTRTLGVLTGEVGSGKSTLLRTLASELPQAEYQSIYLSTSRMTVKELYAGLLSALGESPMFSVGKIKQQWREYLQSRQTPGQRQLVLLIDEVHEMTETTLLELRFLMMHDLNPSPVFPVILAGQAALRRKLNTNLLEPISQRVRLQYHLSGGSPEECTHYIEQVMDSAGLKRPVFTEDAVKTIFAATQGIPRLINQLCANVLLIAEPRDENAIEQRHVQSALSDMDRQKGTGS